jgi:lipopolysaccharide/colanic/teichoic acid biosynthesis glycosyltransferase
VKICFFNRSFYPDLSATGQLLTELAGDLVHGYGWRVAVVTGPPLTAGDEFTSKSGKWGRLFLRESFNGIDIFRGKGTKFQRGRFIGRFANYLSYFFTACYTGLRVPRPDVVVALTDPPIIGLAALLAARRAGAKFVFLCQDVFPEVATLLEDFHSPTVNRILQWVNRFLIRKADRVVALGETMRDRLVEGKGADRKKVSVIHNWADCSTIVPAPRNNPFSLSHDLNESFVVMHSGNVGLSQNLETLIEAAERLRNYSEMVVLVVGGGVKKPELEAKAKSMGLSNVKFLPYQPKARLTESFATADLFVISLKRGLAGFIVPSKLYGILAAGRPYVAAVEAGCEVALVTNRFNCGLIAEPGNAADLAEKIEILYRDRDLAWRLGENARRAALHFDRQKQVRAYNELFSKLVDTSREDAQLRTRTPVLKRSFDILLSGFGLLVSSPLWMLIASLIKVEDRGPVFFAQERVGQGGRCFTSWKFRSMVPNADEKFGPIQAQEKDPRVTKVGRVLRATAMDELPQLWNIFKGDMSFVGPRALASREIELDGNGECVALEEISGYRKRHAVRPGLTGVAQVYAPRDIPRRTKFRYDLLYVRKQSFWLDLKLIAVSFWITFRGKWETRGQKF